MLLSESFDDFLKNTINLNKTRLEKIRSVHNSVRDRLQADDEVKPLFLGSYLQGSYKQGTAIRPLSEDDEYDVDTVIALNLEGEDGNLRSGRDVLYWVQERLEKISLYKGKTEVRPRCVRVNYEDDGLRFHLDVLPAQPTGGLEDPIQIPRDWIESHPRGFEEWCRERNRDRCGRFKEVTRLLKFWRNLHSDGEGPNSMVLTTLVGLHLPKSALSLDDALVKTMQSINGFLADYESWQVPVIENPSLAGENLARSWSYLGFSSFKTAFSEATEAAAAAKASKEEVETIELWNSKKLFDGNFPTTVRDLCAVEKRMSAAMMSGCLFVGSNGNVMPSTGRSTTVHNNRGFYGEEK